MADNNLTFVINKQLQEELVDLKKENKYAEKRIAVLLEGKMGGYKSLFNNLPTVVPYIEEKDREIESLKAKLKELKRIIKNAEFYPEILDESLCDEILQSINGEN